MDLVDMQKLSRWNKANKYLLTVIDVLSKYAWAVPIKQTSLAAAAAIAMAPHRVTPKTVPEVLDRLYGQRLEQKTPPPNVKWAIAYASTRNIASSKKAIYRDGRKKYLWSRMYVVILWASVDSVNGMARL